MSSMVPAAQPALYKITQLVYGKTEMM